MTENRRGGRPRKPPVSEDRTCPICCKVFTVTAPYKHMLRDVAKTCSKNCQTIKTAKTMLERAQNDS